MTEFDTFWQAYPRKVGKLAALEKYRTARKMATAEEILAGVARYKQNKPGYADWCHAKTWLSQGRWLDEYETPRSKTTTSDWWDECRTVHGGACGKRWDHEIRMRTPAVTEDS